MESAKIEKKNKEIEEIKDIFDKIDDFDNMFETSLELEEIKPEINVEIKADEQQQ